MGSEKQRKEREDQTFPFEGTLTLTSLPATNQAPPPRDATNLGQALIPQLSAVHVQTTLPLEILHEGHSVHRC